MAFDYSGFKDLANGMIAEFGQTATLRKLTYSGTIEKIRTQDDTTVKVVEIDAETDLPYRAKDGAVIPWSVRTFYMGTEAGVVPDVEDLLLLASGESLSVNEIVTTAPSGDAVVYEIRVEV